MAFTYANSGSDPNAGGIGWFDFENLTIAPDETVTGLTGTLANGITITFDLTLSSLGGQPRTFTAVPAPYVPVAYSGAAEDAGLPGNIILYSGTGTESNLSSLTFSNIFARDAEGNPVSNYAAILANGENLYGDPDFEEGLSFNTEQSPEQVTSAPVEVSATTSQGVAIGFVATVNTISEDTVVDSVAPVVLDSLPESNSNIQIAAVNEAVISAKKTANKTIAYLGDTITYYLALTNSGNVPADHVVITDPMPNGTTYISGSTTVNAPFTGDASSAISLQNPIMPGKTVSVSFQVTVSTVPNPNPAINIALVQYYFTTDPSNPDGVSATTTSNAAAVAVFRNNYSQQISDLIESIALEEAALAAITNAEGAKIQKLLTIPGVTPEILLCANKSVSDMLDSISVLESILKQKLSTVDCQINALCKQ